MSGARRRPEWPEPDLDRAAAALVEVERRFDGFPWAQYRRLDQEHRSRTLTVPAWFPDWLTVRPEHVAELADRSGRPVAAGGLLSMHPNGYVREAAVGVLATTPDPRALPLLLVRCADWVPQVRLAAQAAVGDRLEAATPDDILPAAPLLESLAVDGSRQSHFAQQALGRLKTALSTEALCGALAGPDDRVRRFCARLLVERGEAGAGLGIVLRQHDPVSVRLIGSAALDQTDQPAAVLETLWHSSNASLRALALYRYLQGSTDVAVDRSSDGLLDRSPSVRFLAQRFLAAEGIDVRAAYRQALPDSVAALQGLAEVGDTDDVGLIEPFLRDERVGARRSAVVAVGRLLGADAVPTLLDALDDPSPSVARAAGRGLARQHLPWSTLDDLWRRVEAANIDTTIRRAAFLAFAQQERWSRLLLACRAVTSDDDELARRGLLLVEANQNGWNQSFSRPAPERLSELRALAPSVRSKIAKNAADELDDLLAHAS